MPARGALRATDVDLSISSRESGARSIGHSAPARGQLGGEVSQWRDACSATSPLTAHCSGTCSSLPLCVRPPWGSLPRQKGASGGADPERLREVTFSENRSASGITNSRRSHGAWSRCCEITNDAATKDERASDQECRDQALSPITDRPATPRGKRSGGLRPTPTNSPSVPRIPCVRGPTARAA